jgi:aryl-alcohol dehydrogenase-like predicted oxidoreductase
VDVVLAGPRSAAELRENLAAVDTGPLSPDEMGFMREFGRAVHG